MATTETPTADQITELRATAIAALKDWFEAGVKAGLDPMLMAGQLAAEMQKAMA